MKQSKITAIDLCCGVGGMTNGLIAAGIDVVAGYDIEETCRYAYETNNNVPFINKDLTNIDAKELSKHFEGANKTYIHFSPPCQPYSNYTLKSVRLEKHPKYNIADKLFDIVLELKPDFISIEEVPKVMKLEAFQARVKELTQYYNIDQQIVNIADWGAPQNRRRYFLIGQLKNDFDLFKDKMFKK